MYYSFESYAKRNRDKGREVKSTYEFAVRISSLVGLLSFLFRIVIVATMGWLAVVSSRESSTSNLPVILPLVVWMRAVEAERDCTHVWYRSNSHKHISTTNR